MAQRGVGEAKMIWRNGLTPGEEARLPEEDKVEICIRWLREFATPGKTWDIQHTSYGHKHRIEKWAGEYIPNGAMIEAARRLGIEFRPERAGSPNAKFRMYVAKRAL